MDRSIYTGDLTTIIRYTPTTFTEIDTSWYQPSDLLTNWTFPKRATKSMTNSNTKKREKKGLWHTGMWITDPTKTNMFTLTNSI